MSTLERFDVHGLVWYMSSSYCPHEVGELLFSVVYVDPMQ